MRACGNRVGVQRERRADVRAEVEDRLRLNAGRDGVVRQHERLQEDEEICRPRPDGERDPSPQRERNSGRAGVEARVPAGPRAAASRLHSDPMPQLPSGTALGAVGLRRLRRNIGRARQRRPNTVFVAPHNDDETLFGAFTLLREKPHVIVCLRSMVQELRGCGITYRQREAETEAALRTLRVPSWEQWEILDSEPDWELIGERLRRLDAGHVFAPAFEDGGHDHHNTIAELAARVFHGRLTAYLTYTHEKRSTNGQLVPFESEWIELKLMALLCYRSQILERSTRDHFLYPQYEYYA